MTLLSAARSAFAPVFLASIAILILRRLTWKKRSSNNIPIKPIPGPRPLPFIGNLHQIPRKRTHLAWKEWGKMYGPLVEVTALGQTIVITNSHRVATELLTERGGIHSGRPFLQMAAGEVGWDRLIAFINPGDEFKEMRRIFHRTIEAKKADKFKSHIQSEVYRFVTNLYHDPKEFRTHVRTEAGSIILLITHGYVADRRPNADPFLVLAAEVMHDVGLAAAPGAWLVDLIPALKYIPSWFPGAEFKRLAKVWRAKLERLIDEPHEWAKSQMRSGTAFPSCTQMLLDEQGDSLTPRKEQTIKWSTGALFTGGSDTTVSIHWTFFLAMSLHPGILEKAHAELDAVVGPDRLPTLDDRPNLPYAEAIITECLRFAPPFPTGFAHVALKDDVYEGHLIKEGTMVAFNIWGMLHDETDFPDPEEFIPERYLEQTDSGWKYVPTNIDPQVVNFGYGRRVCPGRELALLSMFNTIAVTLHLFNITTQKGHSHPMREHEYEDAFLSHPTDFECDITVRSKAAEKLLLQIEHSELSSTY